MRISRTAAALLFFATILQGCSGSGPVPAISPGPSPLTYLALGDSYTIGESVDSIQRWPVQLAAALSRSGVNTAAPRIIARTGWTTDELAAGIDTAGVVGSYDLVSLLIGVNNQYRGRSPEEFRSQFVELLDHAVSFAGRDPQRVVVLSIPDWGVMPFAEGRDRATIATEIDTFNAIKQTEAERIGVLYVDITDLSRQADALPELVATDGLHPSGAMYRQWVERTLPIVLESLRSTRER